MRTFASCDSFWESSVLDFGMTALQRKVMRMVCVKADIPRTPGKGSGCRLLENVGMDNSED